MMRRNSCWFTSPSPSLSASSIISFTNTQQEGKLGQNGRMEEADGGSCCSSTEWWHWQWSCVWIFWYCYTCTNLQFLIGEVLSQLFGYSLQVLEWDPARLIIIEQPESFQDFLLGVLLSLWSERSESSLIKKCHSAEGQTTDEPHPDFKAIKTCLCQCKVTPVESNGTLKAPDMG